MKISEKIEASNAEILIDLNGAGGVLANKLGELAAEAMFDGIKSRKWAEYMTTFADNKQQLERLCGEDTNYPNDNLNNKRTLAYVVGNSVCTVDTRQDEDDHNLGTLNYLTPGMIEALDAGLSEKPDEPDLPDTTDNSESPESESN